MMLEGAMRLKMHECCRSCWRRMAAVMLGLEQSVDGCLGIILGTMDLVRGDGLQLRLSGLPERRRML